MYEKENPAHPDKVADRITGALVDYNCNLSGFETFAEWGLIR